ncbi:MAG: hypothetical protein JWL63_2777 [Rhodocyclales bacterium]|nr:hypothetical protein [Rhodocyclales bacterium]
MRKIDLLRINGRIAQKIQDGVSVRGDQSGESVGTQTKRAGCKPAPEQYCRITVLQIQLGDLVPVDRGVSHQAAIGQNEANDRLLNGLGVDGGVGAGI